jgi:hypothetical protein
MTIEWSRYTFNKKGMTFLTTVHVHGDYTETVSVKVEGLSTNAGGRAEDYFNVSASAGSLSGAGSFTLSVSVRKWNPSRFLYYNFEVDIRGSTPVAGYSSLETLWFGEVLSLGQEETKPY